MLDWLFRKSNFYRFQDSFGFSAAAVSTAIQDAIRARMEVNETVLLLAHFPDRLSDLEKMLDQANIPFEIGTKQLDEVAIANLREEVPNHVILTMAEMLNRSGQKPLRKNEPSVAVMIAERHPMPKYDQAIVDWSQWLPFPVQLGYFMSLDDPVVSYAINDQVKVLLSQFGMGENELVTSNLVSRRIERVLKRMAKNVVREVTQDSAAEWLEANYLSE